MAAKKQKKKRSVFSIFLKNCFFRRWWIEEKRRRFLNKREKHIPKFNPEVRKQGENYFSAFFYLQKKAKGLE